MLAPLSVKVPELCLVRPPSPLNTPAKLLDKPVAPRLNTAPLDSRTSGATEPVGKLALPMAASDCAKPLRSSTVPADIVSELLADRLLAWAMSMAPACSTVAPVKLWAPLRVNVPAPSLIN